MVAAIERASKTRRGRQPPELLIAFGIGVDIGSEPDARIAALGEAGVSHDGEHRQTAVVDRAMHRAGRELDEVARRQRHAPKSIVEVMQFDRTRTQSTK
jgi:hypothetical protein